MRKFQKTISFTKKVDQVLNTILHHCVRYPVFNKDQFMNTCIMSIIYEHLYHVYNLIYEHLYHIYNLEMVKKSYSPM
jgi:hypothetical protein